jgi:hypothetical protein
LVTMFSSCGSQKAVPGKVVRRSQL